MLRESGESTGLGLLNIAHRTTQEAVVQHLRSHLINGTLRPGSRLIQTDLASEMGVSTTPVREALRQLTAEGFVDLDPHKGFVVHTPTREEFLQTHEIRVALEPIAIVWTVRRASPHIYDRAKALIDAMDDADPKTYLELNGLFHELLADAGQNPRLASILGNLRDMSNLYVARAIHSDSDRAIIKLGNRQHRELLAACKAGYVEKAQEVQRAHLDHTLEAGLSFFESQGW